MRWLAHDTIDMRMKAQNFSQAMPAHNSSKKRAPAIGSALSAIWQDHLHIMERELSGILGGVDIEALHRFRTALRKTRALLKIFAELLPQAKQFDDELRWLAKPTGAIRDVDILLQQARRQPLDGDVTPILVALEAQRQRALAEFAVVVNSRRFRTLLLKWRTYVVTLASPVTSASPQLASAPPMHGTLKPVLKYLLLQQTHKLLKKGRGLHPQHASSRQLHKLRIRGKNLRYLIDSFSALLRNDAIRSMRKRLGKLQDILGQHQDSVMTAAHLTALRNNNDKSNDNNDKSNDNDKSNNEQLYSRETASAFNHWIEMAQRRQLFARIQYRNALLKLARASKQLPA